VRDPDTQRRFNVAASRAQDQLWLFHSVTLNDLRPECLRSRLLAYCLNPKVDQPEEIGQTTITELRRMGINKSFRERKPREADASLPFDSWFEVDVFIKILDRGYRVLPQYEVAGYRIDLVVEGLKGQLAVECDGDAWHGPDKYESDMARQRDLQRCGWMFCRVGGTDFTRDPDAALTELWETLERLKITPRQAWESDRKKSEKESTTEDSSPISDTADRYRENPEDEAEGDDDGEKKREEESPSAKNAGGRLDHALEYARLHSRGPEAMPPLDIQNAILQSLQKCPNRSCTLKSLTSRALKELGVLTRGNPRLEFEKRVMRNLGVLKRKGLAEEYKAKNKRIRLLA